jgi:hypothetical protein
MSNNNLHISASAQVLGLARIVVYSAWAWILLRPLEALSDLPRAWFMPMGPMGSLPDALWDFLLQRHTLLALRLTALVLCILLAAGARPFRPLAFLCAALLLVFDFSNKAFLNYVNHAQAAFLYVAWILPFFPAADGMSLFRSRLPSRPAGSTFYAAPMVLAALALAVPYTLLGIRRLLLGGLEIFTGDAILVSLATKTLEYSRYDFLYGLLPLNHPWMAFLAKASFLVITIMELLAPLALFHRTFRIVWLAVILPFHIGTFFTMKILFWENMLLIIVFLSPLPYLITRTLDRKPAHSHE